MKTQRLGHVEVTKIVEIASAPMASTALLPAVTEDLLAGGREWLPPGFIHPTEAVVYLSFHSYVLRTGRHTILVDACCGNGKSRESMPMWHMLNTPYLEELAKIGLEPADIDVVLCTHLHADHVGWNTRLIDGRWVPTFPNARYVMGRVEFEHWQRLQATNPPVPVTRGAYLDSVVPVVEAGQAVMVEPDYVVERELGDGVWLEPSPGHSPGHMSVCLESGGAKAVFCGDAIHHPLQLTHPHLGNAADFDRVQGEQSRRALLERIADTPTLLLTAHFPVPTAGCVVRRGEAFSFRFSDVL